MAIFNLQKGVIKRIQSNDFLLEKDIQSVIEKNLKTFFGLDFVQSEFQLNGLRIDTLAFDSESNSFVIIEYKKGKSFSVIDQGFAYLSLMLNNKADFILEYNENKNQSLKREDIDWSQSKVIFVASAFNKHQQNAINFKDLPIELWEIQRYEGDLINLNQIQASDSSESIEKISSSTTVKAVAEEVKKYNVEDHFKVGWDDTLEIYKVFLERLLEKYPELTESPKKQYIGFQLNGWNVISVYTYKSGISVILNRHKPEDLKDPEKMVTYWDHSFERYNQHMSKYKVNSIDQIDYAMYLIKQVYDKFIKDTK